MHKLFILLMLTSSLFFTACPTNNDSTVTPPPVATTTTTPATTTPPVTTTRPPNSEKGSIGLPTKAGNDRITNILLQNYWVIVKYYHPIPERMAEGRGRWFKFEKDGTFVSGRWKDTTASGVWKLTKREGKNFILLDSSIDYEDAEFEIQKIRGEEDAMAWVGSERYPSYDPAAFQIDNLLTIPTKAQFGE